MNENIEFLQLKLKDYQRFIVTLLILSSYLYMGAIINTYIQPSSDGNALFNLSFTITIVAMFFFYKKHRIKKKLEDNERV
ncbi:YrhC family protein [Virgibacillus byunsanensis]|uniref:YrhC family protein n=1 Tax=Virgibacillus byunsanensis TaxID=570945 RepID=A0ABW3LL65_9BACI